MGLLSKINDALNPLERWRDKKNAEKAAEQAAKDKAAAAKDQAAWDDWKSGLKSKFDAWKKDSQKEADSIVVKAVDPGPSKEEKEAEALRKKLEAQEKARRGRSVDMKGGGREGLMYKPQQKGLIA